MKHLLITSALLSAVGLASAHELSYRITTTFFEPDTQPRNTIFQGSFDYNEHTRTISNLQGLLSEAMSGTDASDMAWVSLSHQLVSWHDDTLGGTFAATFKNASTSTFWSGWGGDGWSPAAGIAVGGTYAGFPKATTNPGNAYALIFVPDTPTAALTQAQIDKLAYADCSPMQGPGGLLGGGMMGATCMTGTSVAGYGALGTMSGYPLSQSITAAVPEPPASLLALLGMAAVGAWAARRRQA